MWEIQYIPRNMHTVFALLCFVVVIHWLIFPYPSGLLHWHCGNLTIAPVPAKQPWWIWINTSCEFIMNDCITTTKQSTTKPCANFLGYTVAETLRSTSISQRSDTFAPCQCPNWFWSAVSCLSSMRMNHPKPSSHHHTERKTTYHQTSNISCTLVGNKIDIDHSAVVGASPVSAAPTKSPFTS